MKLQYNDFINQFNTSEINRQLFTKPIVPHIARLSPPDSSTAILSPALGGGVAVQAPVSLIIDTETIFKHPNAINFIFEVQSTHNIVPMLLLRLFNIQFASTMNNIVKTDSIFVTQDGINTEETEQAGIIVGSGTLSHHHIFTLPRSYLIYVCLPCDGSSKIQYDEKQCDELVDNGIQDFYNILIGTYKDISTTILI